MAKGGWGRSDNDAHVWVRIFFPNLDPELFCACRGERSRALGDPGARLSLIGFSKKQKKSVSDWSIQVCTRAVDQSINHLYLNAVNGPASWFSDMPCDNYNL